MPYSPQSFKHLLGTEGFSDELLENHFSLYEAYVTHVNTMAETLEALRKKDQMESPEYGEVKRRFGWEFDGMRLHELYFGNMTRKGSKPDSRSHLARAVSGPYGSWEGWEKDFRSTGAIRGVGWAILYRDPVADRVFNCWVDEHDAGHLAGCQPLLVLDVFEHAYMTDYGVKRDDYIEAFWNAIDWSVVAGRHEPAATAASSKMPQR